MPKILHYYFPFTEDHQKRFKKVPRITIVPNLTEPVVIKGENMEEGSSYSDQFWLDKFEAVVRNRAGKLELNLSLISNELAISERQLFRHVDRILGITPNRLVRVIRLQLAWEAFASGKYRTIKRDFEHCRL